MGYVPMASEAVLSPQSCAKVTNIAIFGKQDDSLVRQRSDGSALLIRNNQDSVNGEDFICITFV